MLKHLFIKNYALIASLRVDFGPGLNIITGETGAGKSILIGAVTLLLGGRARGDVLRTGAKKLVIEGEFACIDKISITDFDEDFDGQEESLILRREISASGRSRCFVNDSPVSLAQMAALGDVLVDLHGQHDHQSLLKTAYHGQYLDAYGVDTQLLTQMGIDAKSYAAAREHYDALLTQQSDLRERRDFLSFQLKEIKEVDPQPDEEEALIREEKILKASERIFDLTEAASQKIFEEDQALTAVLAHFEEELQRLSDVDTVFSGWTEQCRTARIQLEEMVHSLQSYASHIDFDPQRLEMLRERLSLFSRLKKKYGPGINDVLLKKQSLSEALGESGDVDERMSTLAQAVTLSRKAMTTSAQALSEARQQAAKRLEAQTVSMLRQLGLEHARFEIRIEPRFSEQGPIQFEGRSVMADAHGMDRIQFFISLNPGQALQPLEKVASGGEISRTMLALKSALAQADQIPVLIFDEIDAGISGRIGRVVGRRLEALAENHQIIAITHLPQIASMGEFHYEVFKTFDGGETETSLRPLIGEARVKEVAKLLAGEAVTPQSMESAKELLEKSDISCS